MRAFVTGGSGFVGCRTIETLAERGDDVIALARSDRAARVIERAGASRVVRGDLAATDAMAAGMDGCDVVFHSAALVQMWGDRDLFHRVNVEGTGNVIAAARRAGVATLVHVSTEAVLVGRPIVDVDETVVRPARPLGPYGSSKAAAEDRVLAANGDGLKTVVVRPRLVWGEGDNTALPQMVAAVRAGQFRWIGGGSHRTSTCHVDNVVEGMLLAAERGAGGAVYFLTDGEPVVMREFMTELLATQGVDAGSRSVPRWVARILAWTVEGVWRVFRVTGEPPITRTVVRLIGEEVTVDDAKARRELGYRATTSIADGLAAMRTAAAAREAGAAGPAIPGESPDPAPDATDA